MKIGLIEIDFPDAVSNKFSITCDLAEIFNTEYQTDAVSKIKASIKNNQISPKPVIDYESDLVSIESANPNTILSIALLINEIGESPILLNNTENRAILESLRDAKKNRPNPVEFKDGDVFSIPLSDKSYAYGQILQCKQGTTCALLTNRSTKEIELKKIKTRKAIAIFHTGLTEEIVTGTYKILGNKKVKLNPNSGHGGSAMEIGSISYGSASILKDLAEAYFCLKPWNSYFDQNYFDKMLLEKNRRPKNAIILSDKEREILIQSYQNQ